jgi:anti-anti-sigma factor
MNLRARTEGQVLVVELEGQVDFESTQQFQEACERLISKTKSSKVLFHLGKLKFVGSSGITHFIRVLKEFNSGEVAAKICNVSDDFSKLFKACDTPRTPFAIFDIEASALESFSKISTNLEESPIPKKRAKKARSN